MSDIASPKNKITKIAYPIHKTEKHEFTKVL